MPAQKSTASGVLTAVLGTIGFSALAGLLVTVMVAPALAVTGITATNTVGIFDSLPDYITLAQQREANEIVAKNQDGSTFHIATVFDQNRQSVGLDQMSDYLKEAAIAGEDRRYYQHGGVDIPSVARAALGQASGTSSSGASTITMQLVRNIRFQQASAEPQANDADRAKRAADIKAAVYPDLGRKVQEMKLAIGLEKRYTKQQILAAYLNIVGMGSNTYGVEAAAEQYYSTTAANLTIAQAASLVAIVQNPSANGLQSDKNYARNQDRRNEILGFMLTENYITRAQYDDAKKTDVKSYVKLSSPKQGCLNATPGYQFVCQFVLDKIDAGQLTGLGATAKDQQAAWAQGGYTVTTSVLPSVQDQANQIVQKYAPPDYTGFALGAAETTVEVGTGRILVMAQNKPFNNAADPSTDALSIQDRAKLPYTAINFNIDRATYPASGSGGYQPGSSYKPYTLLAFLAAGHGVNETFDASKLNFNYSDFKDTCADATGGAPIKIRNDEGEGGPYTVTRGTGRSVNSVFMQMATKLDQCDIQKTAASLGVHNAVVNTDKKSPYYNTTTLSTLPSCVIGGCSNNVTPLMQAAAYAAIADQGVYCTPTLVDSITDAQGNSIPGETRNCAQDPLVSPDVANTAAYAMATVFAPSGTAGAAGANPKDGTTYIGKTGTTDESRHTWTVGSSTKASTALWVGNIVGTQALRSIRVPTGGGTIQAALLRNNIFSASARAIDGYPGLGGGSFPPPSDALLKGQQATVPGGLVGGSVEAAQSALDLAGLSYQDGGDIDSDLPAGVVASTDPPAGTALSQGSTVTVYTSNGQAKQIPNVVGKDPSSAQSTLASAGFTQVTQTCVVAQPTDPPPGPGPTGTVTAQDPPAGSTVNPSNPVKLTVRKIACP